jgi:hypothetical protein
MIVLFLGDYEVILVAKAGILDEVLTIFHVPRDATP